MKKQIPVWKKEHEWLKECYSQCLQSSKLNLSIAFINFFDGLAQYPKFKKRQGRQSIQYPQNIKILSNSSIKFSGHQGILKAKIHGDAVREFDCPHCQWRHDRDINARIDIRNEGLRILALGTSVTALRGNVRPKQYSRKSRAAEAVALEFRRPHHTGSQLMCGSSHIKF